MGDEVDRRGKYIIFILTILIININMNYSLALDNDENRNFRQITVEDGLSQSYITKIFQDSKGYMWIGTRDGLNKYNGHKFEIYKYSENDKKSIVGSSITDIVEDLEGNIWIGTSMGLSKIDAKTEKVSNYLPDEDGCNISHYKIRDILSSKDGNILVATDNGLNVYDKKEDNFIRVFNDSKKDKSLSDQKTYSLEEDEENYWVGTQNGLNKINKITNKITKYYSNGEENSLGNNLIYSLHIDNKGYLWVGTIYGGLNRINLDTWEIDLYTVFNTNMPGNYIRDVIRDSRDTVWVATDYGLAKLDEETKHFTVYKSRHYDNKNLLSNDITSIHESKSGEIWIGTSGGINLFNPENLFKHYKHNPANINSISDNSISGIYEDDDGILWIGTWENGVNIFDRENNKVTRLSRKDSNINTRLSDDLIREIVGIDNEIWIATQDGLNKYDKETNKVTVYRNEKGLISNDIMSLHIDKDGVLWIGTSSGVSSFDRKDTFTDYSKIFSKNGVNKSSIFDIYEDENNILWFACSLENELIKYDRNKNEIKSYKNYTNKKYNMIFSVTSDDKGNLWLGSDYGLIKIDIRNKSYKRYTEEDGLVNNTVYGVLVENDENIWISTNNGLSKFNVNNEKFVNFDSIDGLQDNEFNQYSYYKNKDGEMFFGGINGLSAFNPKDISENKKVPDIQIENIKNDFENLEVKNDSINLSYKDKKLQFYFFIPGYSDIQKIEYEYRLYGVDKDWISSGNRNYVSYTNLKHGKYVFEVRGRNSSGIWSDPTSIVINVETPPWKTPLAYIIYVLIGISIVYLVYNRVKLLDKLVQQRTIELNKKLDENNELYSKLLKYEKHKNNYFANLSHELKTPLNVVISIQNLIGSLNKKKENIPKEKLDYYVDTMGRNCSRLSNLIDNIIYTSKIELGNYKLNIKENDIVYIVEDSVLSMKEYVENKSIELIIDTTVEEKFIECDEYEIRRSIINIMSNAIKFTGNNGNIEVHIIDLTEYIKISIKDSGIGIEEKHQESIFNRFDQNYKYSSEEHGGKGLGLTLTRQLVELHNGCIFVESELGKGSEFVILLPEKQNTKTDYNKYRV